MKLVLLSLMLLAIAHSQVSTPVPVITSNIGVPVYRTQPYIPIPVVVREVPVAIIEEPIIPEEPEVQEDEPFVPEKPRYFHNLKYKTGDDVLAKLRGGNHDIYVIVFYHPEENNQHLGKLNRELIEKLENDFLYKNDIKNVFYATVDCSNPKNSDLMSELDIDPFSIINKPQLLVMEHGNGFIMAGPKAVEEMKKNLNELLENRLNGY